MNLHQNNVGQRAWMNWIWPIVCVAIAMFAGCIEEQRPRANVDRDDAAPATSHATGGERPVKFELSSTAFKNGQAIPKKYTGEGDDVSPPLAWAAPPPNTKELALICDDPDAPSPEPWVHWVIYGIPADVHSLPEGVKSNEPQLKKPIVARQGKNSFGSGATIGYRGPLPPPGHGVHHYHFKLYALDAALNLAPGTSKKQLLDAMKGHVLTETELVGTYERKS
jgi:Raf kinase inhibitor-like YbhB/YbcL family protein